MRSWLFLPLAFLLVGCTMDEAKTTKDAPPVKLATASTWEDDVLKSPDPVLVDFGADYCPPCRKLEPVIASLGKDFQVRKVDVEKEGELAHHYRIRTLPTLIIFDKGKEVSRFGYTDERTLRAAMQQISGKS